jgi:hypothetical protein
MRMRILVLALAAVGLLLLAPGAMAHTTHLTDDGQYCIVIGQQGEPVNTFQRTNLDLIIRPNLSGSTDLAERDCDGDNPVDGVHETLNAYWIAPGGEEHHDELVLQRGQVRYQFANTYMLTQPGYYNLYLEGHINGSPVDGEYLNDHNIRDMTELMFPDQGLPNPRDTAALEARVAALEAQLAEGQGGNAEAPGPGALVLVGLIAFSALFLRSRARQ